MIGYQHAPLASAGCIAWREGHRQWCCAIIGTFCNWSAFVGNRACFGHHSACALYISSVAQHCQDRGGQTQAWLLREDSECQRAFCMSGLGQHNYCRGYHWQGMELCDKSSPVACSVSFLVAWLWSNMWWFIRSCFPLRSNSPDICIYVNDTLSIDPPLVPKTVNHTYIHTHLNRFCHANLASHACPLRALRCICCLDRIVIHRCGSVCLTNTMVLQGALTLLNVETGLDTVSELEAIGAFIVMLLLTEDLKDKKK